MRQVRGVPIWIGHAGDLRNLSAIASLGIEAVVQLAAEEPAPPLPRDLTFVRFPLLDGSGNLTYRLRMAIEAVASLIRDEVPCLVGCSMGRSRSPAIVAAGWALVRREPVGDVLIRLANQDKLDVSPALWDEILAVHCSITNEAPWR